MGRTDARIERRRRKLHEPPCKPGRVDFAGPRLRTDGRTSVSRLCESVSCELCASRGGEWRGVEGQRLRRDGKCRRFRFGRGAGRSSGKAQARSTTGDARDATTQASCGTGSITVRKPPHLPAQRVLHAAATLRQAPHM